MDLSLRKSCYCVALAWFAAVARGNAAQQAVGIREFTLPAGFEIQAVTTTKLVRRPVNASFDDQGRLYVTDSSGSSEGPKEQAQDPQWRVVRLADTDDDGVFDQSLVVADRLPMLQGILWHPSGLYIGGTPSIWKLTDFDQEGRATKRLEWWNVGHPSTHCGNEVHGPYGGPDGFIYWTKGAFEPVAWTNSFTGQRYRDRGAHIFRARPDGSAMESLMTGGMDNPVGVAFQPDGEILFSSTFIDFTQPGFRDGLAHASYGAVFGKANDILEDRAVLRTGPELMHPVAQLGAAAPSGLVRYEGGQFGPTYRDRIFVAEFNHRKISSHALSPKGASYAAESADFIATDDMDFHPTDVLADSDGSLLVVDTGGWYKLCCPSSQLWKPDVLGTIYRVCKTGVAKMADPWGRQWDGSLDSLEQLAMRLGDERPAVRSQVAVTLARKGAAAVPTLVKLVQKTESLTAALGAVWTLSRIDAPEARAAVARIVASPPPVAERDRTGGQGESILVRTALKVVARQRDVPFQQIAAAEMRLLSLLAGSDSAVRRNVAEIYGQLGQASHAQTLLQTADETVGADPVLTAAVIRALVDTAKPETIRNGLSQGGGRRRAAMVALAETKGAELAAASVAPFLIDSDSQLRELAQWVVQRRPEWSGDLADWMRRELKAAKPAAELLAALPILAGSESGQQLVAELVQSSSAPVRSAAVAVMAGAGLKQIPEFWWSALVNEFEAAMTGDESSGPRLEGALEAARGWSRSAQFTNRLSQVLETVAGNPKLPAGSRIRAVALIASGRNPTDHEWTLLTGGLQPSVAPALRTQAAEALARAQLDPLRLRQLLSVLPQVGPLELSRLLVAYDRGGNEVLGNRFLETVRSLPTARSVSPSLWTTHFAKFPETVQVRTRAWIAEIAPDARQEGEQLTRLLAEVQSLPRDVRHGQAVFNSPKAACSSCHRIGYQGGNLGPDLTAISQGRSERDLLEAVVFPSASFVRSYEPELVATKDGEVIAGMVRKESESELVVATGPGVEQRIAKSEIVGRQPGKLSVMPAGLDTQLSRQELADLIAFLKNTKWGAN